MLMLMRFRHAWACSLLLVAGLSLLCVGCNPQSLSMLLGTLGDNKVDPEYKLFADKDKKEVTLAVLVNFKRSQFQEEICNAETELTEQLSQFLRNRCEENKQKLKLVPAAQVHNLLIKQVSGDGLEPAELGREVKADYVLHLEIESLRIYEPKSYPKLFHAAAEIAVDLYKIKLKDTDIDNVVFSKHYSAEYPKDRPSEEGGSLAVFRRAFLQKVAQEVSRMFIAYPPEEKHANID